MKVSFEFDIPEGIIDCNDCPFRTPYADGLWEIEERYEYCFYSGDVLMSMPEKSCILIEKGIIK